jgi:hypothetical protein
LASTTTKAFIRNVAATDFAGEATYKERSVHFKVAHFAISIAVAVSETKIVRTINSAERPGNNMVDFRSTVVGGSSKAPINGEITDFANSSIPQIDRSNPPCESLTLRETMAIAA